MTSLSVQAIVFVVLLLCGYLFGRMAERRHFRRIVEREKLTAYLPVVATRYPPQDQPYRQELVCGNVVIAADYFKMFVSGLINIFGGRVTPFESMLDRARRESLLRMKDQAIEMDARYVFNIKYETTRIAVGRSAGMEVLAYGTAMIPPKPQTRLETS